MGPVGTFQYGYTIFVDATNGLDTNNGGITSPVKTIAKAIVLRNAISDLAEVSIFVAAGSYAETPTITKSNTFLCGFNSAGANRSSVNINGTVTVNITSVTTPPIQVAFSDFQLTGLISFTGTNLNQATQYDFENINFNSNTGSNMISILNAGSNYDATRVTNINNCTFTNTNAGSYASIYSQKTTLTITNSQFYSTITAPALKMDYASICYARFCSFINTSSNQSCYSLIQFAGSYNSPTPLYPSFENCIMRYYSSSTDVGGNKCCIQFGSNTGTYQAQIYNNTMYCEGAVNGAPQINAIQKSGTCAVTVLQYGNACGASAHHIDSSISVTDGNPLTH